MNRLILTEARRRGIAPAALEDAVREMQAAERMSREREEQLRQDVWARYAWTRGCLSFWRHGMRKRFRRAFGDGDRTLIPKFDDVAKALASHYPEYLGDGEAVSGNDCAERLYDLLAAPMRRLTPLAELVAAAVAALDDGPTAQPVSTSDGVPACPF